MHERLVNHILTIVFNASERMNTRTKCSCNTGNTYLCWQGSFLYSEFGEMKRFLPASRAQPSWWWWSHSISSFHMCRLWHQFSSNFLFGTEELLLEIGSPGKTVGDVWSHCVCVCVCACMCMYVSAMCILLVYIHLCGSGWVFWARLYVDVTACECAP